MSYMDSRNPEHLLEMHMQAAMRRAETRCLLRQASIEKRAWLPRPGCWLLCRLGHLLVALGERLERCGLPQSPALQGQTGHSR